MRKRPVRVLDVDETQESVESCETSITTGLRCEPVAQAEVCDVARPCPQSRAAGGGPDMGRTHVPPTPQVVKIFLHCLWQVSYYPQGYQS